MTAPKKARFDQIVEADGYKFVPANKTAKAFCAAYGTDKMRPSEAITVGITADQINFIAR